MKRTKINFIIYSTDDEFIITTPKNKKQTEKLYFAKDSGRNIEDYDIKEVTDIDFAITSRLHIS